MTLKGAMMQLKEMRDNTMMPFFFKPYFDKVIETVSECVEPYDIPHWIPCSERLPEKADYYLVQAMMNGNIFVARWEGCYWNVKTPIIAWMPLPEAYEGGDSE